MIDPQMWSGKRREFIRKLARHRRPRLRAWQFPLMALMIVFTACPLLFAFLHYSGDTIAEKYDSLRTLLPLHPASGFLAFLFVSGALPIALFVGYGIYRLGPRKGFVGFAVLASISLIGVPIALTLQIDPLSETELRDLQIKQIIYAVLLYLPFVVPISSFAGWYASTEDNPMK